jgi:hypothetical protein
MLALGNVERQQNVPAGVGKNLGLKILGAITPKGRNALGKRQ